MAVAQVKTKIPAQQQGVDVITLRIDVAAAADGSTAFTFARPFAAIPRVLGAPVRVDNNALDVAAVASITALTATGGTLRLKGTTTVVWTFDVTFIGDYNNPTAY